MLGKTLGRYEILDELGAGGMATVYRARDQELGREVAIKMMHPHLAKREEHAERFRREARAVARLRHPNIIEIHDFVHLDDDDDGQSHTFMVSELVDGPSLSEFLKEQGVVLPEVAALIAAKVADGLAAAHDAGIIHRDVKPENVLIAPGGRVVLTDFGIARVLEGETVTATGALIGSPSYMSPEQAKGLRPRTGSDCFSLGVMLYRMATGQLPFPGGDPLTVISAILKGRYVPPLQVAPVVGTTLDRIIVRCLEPDAEARTSSAEELAEELLDFAAEGGLTDPDAELERFFSAPKEYQGSATRRIVTSLLSRVEDQSTDLSLAGALSLCDRILSLDPENTEAVRIVQNVGRRRSRSKVMMGVGASLVVGLLVALTWGVWQFSGWADGEKRRASGQASPELAEVRDAGSGGDGGAVAALWDARGPVAAARDGGASVAKTTHTPPSGNMHSGRRRRSGDMRARPMQAGRGDAGVRVVLRQVDAAASPPAMTTGPGRLQVLVMPYCNIQVDGRPYGRSPMPKPRSIAAGPHRVTCRHPISGKTVTRQVVVESGRLTRIRQTLLSLTRVTVRLSRSTSIVIGSATYRPGVASIPPGRHPFRLIQAQTVVARGWLSIPPGRCTLTDSPKPRCR